MDLATLKFVVDTKELEDAATKVAELGAAVSKLNKPMQDLSSNTNKVSTATEKASKATENKAKADEKAVTATSKLDGLLDKLTNRYTDMAKGSTSAEAGVLQLARSLGATTESALKPYKDILESIRELSKSPFDSAIGSVRSITQEYDSLTYRSELAAKGIFLTTTQLKEYSRIANEIKGKLKAADLDPTQGEGLAKFNSELKTQQELYLGIANKVNTLKTAEKERNDLLSSQMKESIRLQEASDNLFKYNLLRHAEDQKGYDQDILAMRKYYSELEKSAKDTEINKLKTAQESSDNLFRINQLRQKQEQDGYKQSMSEMRKYYSDLEKQSKQSISSQPVKMDAAVEAYRKNQAKVADDAAKANAYLAKEMERVNRLNAEGESVTSATNNRLIKFEQALKASGDSAEQQAAKLAIYRKELLATQKAAGNRQIDYLSRALGPQITDIGVGLATGQAPLTILLQQGGQLRDQFALAGVAGSEMGKMLVQASKAMVTSIKDIGLAVGQLVTGAITGTGKAIFDGIIAPFKRLSEARDALKQLNEGIISNLRYTRLMEVANGKMIQSFVSFGKVAAVTGLVALGMLAKGLFDVIKEQDSLTTQLVLTGASLGVNTVTAISYANALNSVGVTTASALKVMQSMAKEGGFVAAEINMVVTSANNLKLAGVAIEDVVKQFAKLKEKPVEALIEIAKATGLVKPEIIALVSELEQQGKTSEAAAIAMKAYANVTIAQKDRLKIELSDFALFVKGLSSSVGEFFDEVFRGLWRKTSPTEAIKREIASIENTIKLGTQASPETKAKNDATLTSLKEQLRLSQLVSDAELTRNNDNIRAAKALGEWQKLSVTNLDKEKKAELDIANIRKVGLEAKKSEAEIEKLIADYKEKNKPPKTPKTDAEKERLRILKESEKYLGNISNLTNEATREQENYTKAQKLALDIFSDPDFKNYPESQRIRITNALEQAHAEELVANELTKQRAIQKQIYDEYIKLQAKRDDAMFSAIDQSIALNTAVKEESDELIFQAGLIGKTDAERKKAVKTRQAELLLAKELADIDKLKSLNNGQDIADLRTQAYQRFADRTKNINAEIANDFAAEMQKQYDVISNGLTDAVITGLFEGGLAGRKKLRDLIVAELKKPITIVVKAVVDTTLGSLIQSFVGSSAGSSAGSFAGSATSSLATSGISNMSIGGATLGAQAGAFGQGIASSFGPLAGMQSSGLATSAAYNAGASASQMAIQAGPYVLAAVVALNALGVFRSTKTVGGGITGTLGAGDLQSYDLTRESGTLFNGPDYAIANQKILKESEAIQQSYSLLRNNTVAMAEALGLATSDIENYVSRFGSDLIHPDTGGYGIDLTGLSPEQVQIKINENLIQATDEMASIVMGTWERVYAAAAGEDLAGQLAPESLRDATVSGLRGNRAMTEVRWTPNQFVRDGEKAIDALTRLSTSLYAANTSMRHFGITLYDNSLAGADAASSFIDLLGGLEKFNESIGFFYENFFSEEEKIVNKTKDLTKEFAKIGEVLPSTREEFKALVLAAKSIGNDSQVKNLLSLQYAFADLVPATEAVATAVDELTGSSMNYARSLIEANRISQGGGAYTESDFMMKYFVPTYESSAITPIDSSLMTSNITYGSANQSLVYAITLVKEEISELRYEVQADVIQNSKTATILTRVVPDGQSLNVTATVDGGVV